MSNLTFDPAALVIVKELEPVSEKKTRVAGPKSQLKVVVSAEKRTRFYIGAELAETLELGLGQNGLAVMTDPNNDAVLALAIVPEKDAQLLGEAKSRKSRNFSCHAIESRLLLNGTLTTVTGTYELTLVNVEGTNFYTIEDNPLMDNELDYEETTITLSANDFDTSEEVEEVVEEEEVEMA